MVDRNYTVYMHTSPSGKRYIGITCKKPEYRWNKGKGYRDNDYFTKAIQKYGWNNIQHEILLTKLTKEEAEQMEIKLIAKYKSNQREFGYNIANGGNTIGKHSEETKRKISEKAKRENLSEETLKKMSENHADFSGGNHPQAKRVYCDRIIFSCGKEVAFYYDKNYDTIISWLNGKNPMLEKFKKLGLRYATKEDIQNYPTYDKEIHGVKANIDIYIGKAKRVHCDKKIFLSVKTVAKYYNIPYGTIKGWLNGHDKMKIGFVKLGLRYATEEDLLKYPIYNENVK